MAVYTKEDIIAQSNYFLITRSSTPFVSREEGGHIRIFPKRDGITSINDLTDEESADLIKTEQIVRKAMLDILPKQGIPVIWVNILDLGNWAFKRNEEPRLHIHMFGRVADAKKQIWPEAPQLPDRSSGFYDGNIPLTNADLIALRDAIDKELHA